MHRLFVAVRPPALLRAQLVALTGSIAGARWQDDDQLHLTLRFVGDVNRHGANDLADALRKVRFTPFDAVLTNVGTFDRKGIMDTLWVGIQPYDSLASLHRKVDRACMSVGLPAEQRTYLPHITLARFGRSGGAVEDFLARHAGLTSAPFTIDNFALFESHLGHDRATYHMVERYCAQH